MYKVDRESMEDRISQEGFFIKYIIKGSIKLLFINVFDFNNSTIDIYERNVKHISTLIQIQAKSKTLIPWLLMIF